MRKKTTLHTALDQLGTEFEHIEWKYENVDNNSSMARVQLWPGEQNEEIMICVYKGMEFVEQFHRQEFFFLNYAYKGDYSALSYETNNRILIHEDECYIGQPFAGYAINDESEDETIVIGVLIQKEAFFKKYFHVLSSNKELFQFFLEPQINHYSEGYIHLAFEDTYTIRSLLELLVIEYANRKKDTQDMLSPLVLALLMEVTREYRKKNEDTYETVSDQIVKYIGENYDHVTLYELAEHFSYHPNYLSSLLSKELGKTFSELVLEQRMERSVALLKGTDLPVSEIASMLGYSNSSNFYKAFKEYYHSSPREYLQNNS